jgi:anti-sigma B factor antagonist
MSRKLSLSVRRGGPTGRPAESLMVAIGGELDIATAPQLTACFDEFLSDGLRRLVVDVNQLTFVDASGMRALAVLQVQAEQRLVAVRLSDVPAQARRLMGVIGPVRDLALGDPAAEAVAEGPRSARTWPETSGACDA